jgi:hypothetical protein
MVVGDQRNSGDPLLLTLLTQISGELQLGTNMNINVAVTLLRVQTTVLSTTPDDFAQFWKEVIEKASEEQIAAAYAAPPRCLTGLFKRIAQISEH